MAMFEGKAKKSRQVMDPSTEWTQVLCRFCREQNVKMHDHYHGGPPVQQTGFLTATQPTQLIDIQAVMKIWDYCMGLIRHMYEEGLLDRQEFLQWLVELLEKSKISEDIVTKVVMLQVLQYLDEFSLSTLLSRRLAHFCAKKMAHLCNESGCLSPRTQSPLVTAGSNGQMTTTSANQSLPSPLLTVLAEYNNCSQHRGLILLLSSALQCITLKCPTAMVWNYLGEGKSSSPFCGSPLDMLPCAPSSLPMPPGIENAHIRQGIRAAEQLICQRSQAVEARWSSDKCQQSTAGTTISRVLNLLDLLDRQNFEIADSSFPLDSLYSKMFNSPQAKDCNDIVQNDAPIVDLLCQWAVTTERAGDQRAFVVAKLLEKRQAEVQTEKYLENDMIDEKGSPDNEMMIPTGLPIYQSQLVTFLDEKAPVLETFETPQNRQAFGNLVLLFAELIRHDVFSHDAYMNLLIARGDLETAPLSTNQMAAIPLVTEPVSVEPVSGCGTPGVCGPSSVKSNLGSVKHIEPLDDPMKADLDNQIFDPQFDFFAYQDEQKPSPEQPASVKSIRSEKQDTQSPAVSHGPTPTQGQVHAPPPGKQQSRHLIYATHFPIPQDENSVHECNQRMVTLYGVGKSREEAKHTVRKVTKRLFSKLNLIDNKNSSEKYNMKSTFKKFQQLSYYDQHSVTSSCTMAVLEQVSSFVSRTSTYLPLLENISYLLDLMEYCLNINGLLEFAIQLLKEMKEVEFHASSLRGSYITSLCLCLVAILRKYHACLLLSPDLAIAAFEGLISVVKQCVNFISDCSSAERCILAYLHDLYTSSTYIKNRFQEDFASVCSKVKQVLYEMLTPTASNLRWDPNYLTHLITSANNQSKPERALVTQLSENPTNRYSFVINALLNVCNGQSIERLNETSILCAELTACCNKLSAEWLGLLKALCCSANHSNCGFIDALAQVDVTDLSIHDSLAVFTAILVARHCFSLHDFVYHVALPSLLSAIPTGGGDRDAETGARLTCHLLLRLFKTAPSGSMTAIPNVKNVCSIRLSSDRHLLAAAQSKLKQGPILAVLKLILILADSGNYEPKSKSAAEKSGDIITKLFSSLEDDEDMDMMLGTSSKRIGMKSVGLNQFAKHTLREMCSQSWVREKFLKDPQNLFQHDLLLDDQLTPKQRRHLLHIICYREPLKQTPFDDDDDEDDDIFDQKDRITKILQNLAMWSLRVNWLELQLMFKQATSIQMSNLLENIAKATIEVFQQQTEPKGSNKDGSTNGNNGNKTSRNDQEGSVWLVAPLISKLPGNVQGRVLRAAGQVLESGNNFWSRSKYDKDRSVQRSTSLLSHQPFLSLVLTCLKGQDEQREGLLNSLHSQLEKFLQTKDEKQFPSDNKIRQVMSEALQLRLSLVGGMFDTIQRNNSATTDWALLFVQLVCNGVVDTYNNSELFTSIIDMLCVMIHGTLVTDANPDKDDAKPSSNEGRKLYQNITKKLRKEVGDKSSEGINIVRQLIPLPKKMCEIIACQPFVDNKGQKSQGFENAEKKQGCLQVDQKMKVSPWDLLEGHKNPAPLSWSWFGAVKMERKPLKYEEQHRLLLYHTHNLEKPASHYLDPPVLPPEDLEPPPDKQEKAKTQTEEKPQTGVESDDGKKPTKKKRIKRVPSGSRNSSYMDVTSPRSSTFYNNEPVMYQQPQTNSWGSYNQTPMNPPYYGHGQQLPPGGPRFGAGFSPVKNKLHTMLNNRHPQGAANYMSPNMMQNQVSDQKKRQMLLRNELLRRTQMQQRNIGGSSSGNMFGQPPDPRMAGMNQQPLHPGMQNQPGYDQTSMMSGQSNPMMQQPGYAQAPSYNSNPSSGMMPNMAPPSGQSGNYLGHHQTPQSNFAPTRQHSFESQYGSMNQGPGPGSVAPQGPSQMHNIPSSNTMSGNYSSMAPQQSYMGPQNVPPSSHQVQQLQQQRMLAMQQRQQQTQQQQTTALLAGLRGHLSGGQPQQQQQQPPQYGQFQQPPQY
ncbi:unnamed protein product [Owenia fusiformis]|uniref:Uncharacterized protein n=1 Tax=Owenia fusiformis TaxID=6347 RepID=A0A8J1Y1P0_OWEFU|nr:unnamed protein product [Owenia fusiformis]